LPSGDIDSDELLKLSNSITSPDTVDPIVVRKNAENNYEIVAGESRWRAARLAGLQEVPVIIKDMNDREAMAINLIETIQKENLNLLQEAKSLKELIDEFEVMVRQL
jgi:ParB family chromosome partitioning protein